MCTSASTACRATSAGVWNSGPTSTSKPRSANAVAITFCPRSWPSWPIFAIRMRGRRPCSSSKASAAARASSITFHARSRLLPVDAGDRPDRRRMPTVDLLERVGDLADGGLGPGRVDGEREQVARLAVGRLASARRGRASTSPASRSARSRSSFSSCSRRTAALSTLSTSRRSSSASRYLLTPITGWRPESIRAWVRAAASSMRSFGSPWSIARAMPPAASTSWMCAHARRARS